VLLAVPIIGAAILVAVVLGADLADLLQGSMREIFTTIASALLSEPVALVAFMVAFSLAVFGGSVLMFLVKGGTVDVLLAAHGVAGSIEHELVVVRTDIAQDKLQPDADEPGKMSEEGAQGESGDLAAGLAKDFTLNLSPGKYVLMYNQPGHYMVGMHIAFVVR